MVQTQTRWDTSYEWKATTLLGLGFGLVGLDRWIIAPLLPSMAQDLGLSIQELLKALGPFRRDAPIFALLLRGTE